MGRMERLLFYGLVIDRRPEAADRGDDITVCGGGVRWGVVKIMMDTIVQLLARYRSFEEEEKVV